LAPHFRDVIVLERDTLPSEPASRKYVPQSDHVHALIKGGENMVAALLPGWRDQMIAAGAVLTRAGTQSRWFEGNAWQPERDLGVTMLTQSRPLLEWTMRRALLRFPNVAVRDQQEARGLVVDSAGVATGVRLRSGDVLDAALIIDASGRGGRLPRWLKEVSNEDVPVESCGMDIGYVTAIFERNADWAGVPHACILRPSLPTTRTGSLITIEGDRWLLTLTGRFGDFAPTDLPGFLEFARSLCTPEIADIVSASKLVSPIRRYRMPTAQWRRFDKMATFPDRVLPVGDVVAHFNPIYAQGMSVAAGHASALGGVLRSLAGRESSGSDVDWQDVRARYFGAALSWTESAWLASTTGDLAIEKTRGERPPDLAARLAFAESLRLASRDPELHRLVFRVRQWLEPASRLREPEFLERLQRLSSK
ncbi:MAG: hypothetical protein K0U93_02380, partial [Gammaproteobacteria bacterium]|nr:hypothetical protein [Gammaproteobacteria bacterium]